MNNHSERLARLVAINSEAHRYYREQLLTSPAAQGPCRYLTQRRLAHVLAADSTWSVGYAPAGWTSLTDHLTSAGFSPEELLAAGVVCSTQKGGIVDRFRDRIMLPQRDHNSDVVGFIGRAAPGAPARTPKYLNSPETPLYNKREVLFGLFENSVSLAHGASPVLVEGPFDVLALSAVGTGSSLAGVAPCGTALTRGQVDLIARNAPCGVSIVAAYDNDPAGRRATAVAYDMLGERIDMRVHALFAAVLPRGADPAEVLQIHGPAGLRRALTDLVPLVKRAIDVRLEPWTPVLDGIDGRVAAAKDLAPLLTGLPQSGVAAQIVDLAGRLHLDPVTVSIAVTDALTSARYSKGSESPDQHSRSSCNKSPPRRRNGSQLDAGCPVRSVASREPLIM